MADFRFAMTNEDRKPSRWNRLGGWFKRKFPGIARRLPPRYSIDRPIFHGNTLVDAYSSESLEIRTWSTPNKAMRPLNWMARFKVWRWRKSLPAELTYEQRIALNASMQQFSEAETQPVPNFIAAPREHKPYGIAARRNWYDHTPNVVPFGQTKKD